MKDFVALKVVVYFIFAFCIFSHIAVAEECAVLDFDTAWARVLLYAPSLAVTEAEIANRIAETRQASLIPNPVAAVEAENLGVRDHSDDNDAEPPQTTFSVAQTLELGGKRNARTAFAASLTQIAYFDSQIERQNLLYELMSSFITVRVAQEKLKIATDRRAVAEQIVEAVGIQVKAGKVSPIQEKKAQLTLKSAHVAVNEANTQLIQARKKLSSMWGSPCPDFESVMFDLLNYAAPPDQCTVTQGILTTFDFARAKQEIISATQDLRLQKANSVPDLTLVFGYRIFNDSNQNGWVVGAEMPIPIFNRNQGNIQRARSEINQSEYQLEETLRVLTEEALIVYERVLAAFEQSEMIREGMLADAIETFNLTEIGYKKGKLEYIDLLDAQRMLFETQEEYIETLFVYHLSKAELDRLSGAYNSLTCD